MVPGEANTPHPPTQLMHGLSIPTPTDPANSCQLSRKQVHHRCEKGNFVVTLFHLCLVLSVSVGRNLHRQVASKNLSSRLKKPKQSPQKRREEKGQRKRKKEEEGEEEEEEENEKRKEKKRRERERDRERRWNRKGKRKRDSTRKSRHHEAVGKKGITVQYKKIILKTLDLQAGAPVAYYVY